MIDDGLRSRVQDSLHEPCRPKPTIYQECYVQRPVHRNVVKHHNCIIALCSRKIDSHVL